MIDLVVDANVAIDWFVASLPGEAYSVPLANTALDGHIQLHVPTHFSVEVCGQLLRQHRSKKDVYNAKWLENSLNALDSMRISIVAIGLTFKELSDLSKAYNLSGYDTPYFHLARMLEIPIASRDGGIISACKAWHVHRWLPEHAKPA